MTLTADSPIITGVGTALTIVGALAEAVFPEAAVAGFTLHELFALAQGLKNAVPDAVAVVDEMKAIQAGGGEPTPEQRASWRARATSIHAAIQAA